MTQREREDLGDPKGKTLVTQRNDLNDLGKTWVTVGRTLVTKGKTLVTLKPNKLPAGPREKQPIGRLFSSSLKFSIYVDKRERNRNGFHHLCLLFIIPDEVCSVLVS